MHPQKKKAALCNLARVKRESIKAEKWLRKFQRKSPTAASAVGL
jgi:hypothetical protein